MFRIFSLALLLFFAASCKKAAERDLEREEDIMTGKWTVASIRVVATDSTGNTIADSPLADQGTVEFQPVGDAFRPALFEGGCARSELVGYFRGKPAGDETASGGWALYWDADPAGKRLIIWGIGPSSSWHRTVNLDYDGKGKGERTLWYTNAEAATPGLRYFYYYTLRK